MNANEKCYQTGNYTEECDCNLCSHQRECYGKEDDGEEK